MELPEIDVVIGIGSGGIPPATFVAFHLNAELVVMTLNYRDEKNAPRYDEPKVLFQPEWDLKGKRFYWLTMFRFRGKPWKLRAIN